MRYKVFGRHTGLRVSELFQGAGMFGTGWGHGAEPEEFRCIFDGYLEAGGEAAAVAARRSRPVARHRASGGGSEVKPAAWDCTKQAQLFEQRPAGPQLP